MNVLTIVATVLTSLNKFANSKSSCLVSGGGVNAPIGSRRELVANCVHTADADATQLDSCVASAGVGGVYWALTFVFFRFIFYQGRRKYWFPGRWSRKVRTSKSVNVWKVSRRTWTWKNRLRGRRTCRTTTTTNQRPSSTHDRLCMRMKNITMTNAGLTTMPSISIVRQTIYVSHTYAFYLSENKISSIGLAVGPGNGETRISCLFARCRCDAAFMACRLP